MAIAAPDLAIRNLALERCQAAAATGQTDHIPALLTYVIELQHREPRFSAIDTSGSAQQIAEVGHLAAFATCEGWVSFETAGLESPGTSAYGGPYSMTVDAHDFAIGDLALDVLERDAVRAEHAHVCPLYPDVIELQDQRVRHAAITTGMAGQMVLNERTSLSPAPSTRIMSLVAMELAAGLEVGSVTVAAPPLAPLGVAAEASERKLPVALSAPPVTQLQLFDDRGRFGRTGCPRRRGRRNVPDPNTHGGERSPNLGCDFPKRPALLT